MVTLNYTDAVLKMPHHLSNEFLVELYEYAKTVLPDEEIVDRFLVLSPDLLKPNPGSGSADASAMSIDEQQAAQEQAEEVEEVVPEADLPDDKEPEQSTSGFKKVNKKNNKDRYFQDKKKNTPYSKPT